MGNSGKASSAQSDVFDPHPEPLGDAMRAQRQGIIERMHTLPEPMRSTTHAHMLIHLNGSRLHP